MSNPSLSRDVVLDQALALADREGLCAVSLRAVAKELGVTPMALYRHVGDKQGLLAGMVERLIAQITVPDAGASPRDRLGHLAAALRRLARSHPATFPLLLQEPASTPAARARRDLLHGELQRAGVTPAHADRVERLLSTFLLGFAASEAGGRFREHPESTLDADLAWLLDLVADALSAAR